MTSNHPWGTAAVSSASGAVTDVGDGELIASVRDGDTAAYGTLYERHVDAARRLARQLGTPADADDLVAEAFTKVLVVLQRGEGPDLAFRAYLLTAIRRLHVDKIRAGSKVHPTDDLTPFEPGVPFVDTAVEGFDNAAAAEAFRSLPERWQVVLWHTEVEGQKPADIAPMLGMSPNSVAALAYRAREGLRQAFLSHHASEIEDDACQWAQQNLGGYVREGLSRRDRTKVQGHLDDCRRCMGVYLELVEVNSGLAALLAPLLLGGTLGAAYLASVSGLISGTAVSGGIFGALGKTVVAGADRAKDFVAANAGLSVAASVAAVAATAGIAVAGANFFSSPADRPVVAQAPAASGLGSSAGTPSGAPSSIAARATPRVLPIVATSAALRVVETALPLLVPSATPTPTSPPSATPTTSPTPSATADPSATGSPTERPVEPSTSPTPSPSSTPTSTPTPSPTTTATPTENPTATPIPHDPWLAIAVRDTYYLDISVGDLPSDTTWETVISFTGGGLVTTNDPRCSRSTLRNGQSITCTVSAGSPITFNTVLSALGSNLAASIDASSVPGDDPGNNVVNVDITHAVRWTAP